MCLWDVWFHKCHCVPVSFVETQANPQNYPAHDKCPNSYSEETRKQCSTKKFRRDPHDERAIAAFRLPSNCPNWPHCRPRAQEHARIASHCRWLELEHARRFATQAFRQGERGQGSPSDRIGPSSYGDGPSPDQNRSPPYRNGTPLNQHYLTPKPRLSTDDPTIQQ